MSDNRAIERLAKNPLALVAMVIAAGLAGAGLMLAWQGRAPALGEQARIESIVHDYLLDHPEIVPQAMERLNDKRNAQTIAAARDQIYTPVGNAWAGNAKGNLTIVEYFDYNCGYCRASLPTIATLLKQDSGLRIIYRELPVLSEESKTAARYSVVAARLGKFAAFHQAMYDGGPISEASIDQALAAAGIDRAKARAAVNDPSIDTEIANNYAVAKQLGMTGTPSWIIGDRVVSSALPIDELRRRIAAARARG